MVHVLPPGGGGFVQGGFLCPGGSLFRGRSLSRGVSKGRPTRIRKAGSMHPTGMLSCFKNFLSSMKCLI